MNVSNFWQRVQSWEKGQKKALVLVFLTIIAIPFFYHIIADFKRNLREFENEGSVFKRTGRDSSPENQARFNNAVKGLQEVKKQLADLASVEAVAVEDVATTTPPATDTESE